jgi:hypothetical protein
MYNVMAGINICLMFIMIVFMLTVTTIAVIVIYGEAQRGEQTFSADDV